MEKVKLFPYEIKDVEAELAKIVMKYYKMEVRGFVTVGPKDYFFPQKYKEHLANFYNMPVRSDDIFINSYQRSGSTWTQELVWLLQNNLDFEKAKSTPLSYRFPFLELNLNVGTDMVKKSLEENKHDEKKLKITQIINTPGTDIIAKISSPRFIKSHLPLSLLPPELLDTAKVIYVARDPRDVFLSLYYFRCLHNSHEAPDNLKPFWNLFIKGKVNCAPIFEHVKEAWNQRHHPNMLFLFYEELCENLLATVQKVASFLDKQYTDKQIQQLCDHLNFNKFKNNSSVNHSLLQEVNIFNVDFTHVRKGKVGGWREHFDKEMIEQADKWIEENLRDNVLRYPTSILQD